MYALQRIRSVVHLFMTLILLIGLAHVYAQRPSANPAVSSLGSAFLYQQQLVNVTRGRSIPIDDTCDFTFSLWDSSTAGAQIGPTLERPGETLVDGWLRVMLDFGPASVSDIPRWIEVTRTCTREPNSVTSPRQQLMPVALALHAGQADAADSVPWSGIAGLPEGFADDRDDVGLTEVTWTDVLSRPAGLDDGDDDSLAGLSCADGHVAQWNGSAWSCGTSSIPAGHMILSREPDPPSGFTATGLTVPIDRWRARAPIPTRRRGMAAAVVNGQIYTIGGWRINPFSTEYFGTVEVYDPATDTWTTKAPMPTARGDFAVAVVNNQIYAIGGRNNSGLLLPVEVYDPASDTWTQKDILPNPRSHLAAAVINDQIYTIGGFFGDPVRMLDVYDPATDTWANRRTMPTARASLAAAVVNNQIYAIGGSSFSVVATVEAYDPATDTWTRKRDMLTRRIGPAAAVLNNEIYVFGGQNNTSSALTTVEVYDPASNGWASRKSMPTPRRQQVVGVIDHTIYTIGGADTPVTSLDMMEEYQPILYLHEAE